MTKKNQNLFIFENLNHFDYKKNKSNLNISFNRVTFIFFLFLTLSFIFSFKVLYLGSLEKNIYKKIIVKSDNRSTIIDREGNIIAKSVITKNVGINPNLVIDKKRLLINLQLLFPNKDYKEINKKINGKKFFYFQKKISQVKYDELILLGDKSIVTEQKISRIYPHKNLFSHLIGQIDDDNNGISGIERSLDYELKTIEEPLKLTLDTELQYLIREELNYFSSIFKNIGSAAILMNINNGEILSMVSLPDFDLNKREKIEDVNYINRASKGVYELGSVFKTFTIAAGLENNVINTNTVFKNLKDKIKCDKYTISEHDKLPQNLNTEQILIRSSNIGAVRIAQKLGIEKYKNFLNSLELLNTINFDLEEVGTPILFKWGKCKLATTSYGHGITTTPLQLAKAYAILGNGGYKIQPSILKKNIKSLEKREQIISEKTSNEINLMLRKVVSLDEGTANFADIEGYEVAGKTGTALKYNSKLKLNTFVSLFPASRPKYVLLVMLDEPKPAPNYVYEFPPSEKFPNGYKYKGETRNTSGWNTVVIAGKIIEKIGPILAINNLEASNNF